MKIRLVKIFKRVIIHISKPNTKGKDLKCVNLFLISA
nr:MAG TPA: hypothetical protein [Caudoviricetes sp.]